MSVNEYYGAKANITRTPKNCRRNFWDKEKQAVRSRFAFWQIGQERFVLTRLATPTCKKHNNLFAVALFI